MSAIQERIYYGKTITSSVPDANLIDFLETFFKTVLRELLGHYYFYYINFDVHID